MYENRYELRIRKNRFMYDEVGIREGEKWVYLNYLLQQIVCHLLIDLTSCNISE